MILSQLSRWKVSGVSLLVLLHSFALLEGQGDAQIIPLTEREALIAIYQSTGGENWRRQENWLGPPGTEGNWRGVAVENGHVTGLSLVGNNLRGFLPPQLGDLFFLRSLNLSSLLLFGLRNHLTTLPPEIGQLTLLESLNVSGNQLEGLPQEIGQLSSLTDLSLHSNSLRFLPDELGNLTGLNTLSLYSNQLLSIPHSLGNLKQVEALNLSSNSLMGLPGSIGELSTLKALNLSRNELSHLPAEMSQMSGLESIHLGENAFSRLPSVLGDIPNLELLDLSGSAIIPPGLAEIQQIKTLKLEGGKLSRLPLEVTRLKDLQILKAGRNQIVDLPQEMGRMTGLRELDLFDNQLSDLPAEISELVHLEQLNLNSNRLSRIPPLLGSLSHLKTLLLGANPLTGQIPPQLGKLQRLESLNLSAQGLSGSIPTELGDMTALRSLTISNTSISGSIPLELGRLQNLESLVIAHSLIAGSIPLELGQLQRLYRLALRENQLEGEIPPVLADLPALKDLDLSGNRLQGEIPPALMTSPSLESLNLSRNRLSGPIPPELAQLRTLRMLRLSGNRLEGPIPSEIANSSIVRNHSNSLDYNRLRVEDLQLLDFLRDRFIRDVRNTQTVPPHHLQIGRTGGSYVELKWTPIRFQENQGGYDILYSTQSGGPYTLFGRTSDKTESSVVVDGLDVNTTYYFAIRSVTEPHPSNPNRLVSENSQEVSATTARMFEAFFPVLQSAQAAFTGFAVSNLSDQATPLAFQAFDRFGLPASQPSTVLLGSRGQIALTGSEIFPSLGRLEKPAWVRMTAQHSQLGNFFQLGGSNQLDGGIASIVPLRKFYFSRASEGDAVFNGQPARIYLSLVNPHQDPVSVRLNLVSDEREFVVPLPRREVAAMDLPPQGILYQSIEEIFGDHGFARAFITAEVTEGEGLVAFQLIELEDQKTLIGLGPLQNLKTRKLYSAQMAGDPDFLPTSSSSMEVRKNV